MNEKEANLLGVLLQSGGNVSSQVCAASVGVSKRSIISYVQNINSLLEGTIVSSSKGYCVQPQKAQQLLARHNSLPVPQNQKDRIVHILSLLLSKQKKMNIFELAESLCISESTLRNDLTQARTLLEEYELQLVTKNELVYCAGSERNMRRMISSILYREANTNFLDYNLLQNVFSGVDVRFIQQTFSAVFANHELFVNDHAVVSLVIHASIMVDRLQNADGFIDDGNTPPETAVDETYVAIAGEVAAALAARFAISFSPNDVQEIALLLISRTLSFPVENLDLNTLSQKIEPRAVQLVKDILYYLNNFYYIQIDEPDFLARFAIHINNLLVRAQTNNFNANPVIPALKTACPFIYELAVVISDIIHKKTGIAINDEEIAYIALHIGSALETSRKVNNRVTAVVVCPTYYQLSRQLVDKISADFNNHLFVQGVVSHPEQLVATHNIDLIISTVPLQNFDIPSIVLSPFYNSADYKKLFMKIEEIKEHKRKTTFHTNLCYLTHPDLFAINTDFANETQVIAHMAGILHQQGFVDAHFADTVYEREAMSFTAFDAIAIPHSITMDAKESAMSILVSKQPIQWGQQTVHVVLMIAVSKQDKELFYDVFECVTMALSNTECYNKAVKATTLDEFIHILVEGLLQS